MTVLSGMCYLKKEQRSGVLFVRVEGIDDITEIELDMTFPIETPSGAIWDAEAGGLGVYSFLSSGANSATHTVVLTPFGRRLGYPETEKSYRQSGAVIACISGAGYSVTYTTITMPTYFINNMLGSRSIGSIGGVSYIKDVGFCVPYFVHTMVDGGQNSATLVEFGVYESATGESWSKRATSIPSIPIICSGRNMAMPLGIEGNSSFIAVHQIGSGDIAVSNNGGASWNAVALPEDKKHGALIQWQQATGQQPVLYVIAPRAHQELDEPFNSDNLIGAPIVDWNGNIFEEFSWKVSSVLHDPAVSRPNLRFLAGGLSSPPKPLRPDYWEDFVVLRNQIVLQELSRDDGTGVQTLILLADFDLYGVNRPISSLMKHVNRGYLESFAVLDIEVDGVLLGVGPGQTTGKTLSNESNSIRVLLRPLPLLNDSGPPV